MGLSGMVVAWAAALAVAAPAGAAEYPFGADLANLPANDHADATCQHSPPGRDAPTGSPSCMWSYINQYPDTLVPPATGSVTTVRVKVGQTTGRMRVNVIRFLFQQTGNGSSPTSSGPYLESYGPEFTPTPNAVTQVATNLPVQVDPTPPPSDTQTVQVIDALALEVEDQGVPIPIFVDDGALTYPVYPGPTAAGVPAPSPNALPSYTYFGLGVLMNGVVTTGTGGGGGGGGTGGGGTGGGGGGTGGGGGAGAATPAVAIGGTTARVKRGATTIPLECTGADCAGALTLQSRAGAAAAKRKPTTYGRSTFNLKVGKAGKVKVKLNKRGRALLKAHKRAKVIARVVFRSGAAKSFRLTLKR